MSSHTPGPWEWDAGDVGIEYAARYCQVYIDGGNTIICEVNEKPDGDSNRKEGHANARLIAAAPDLLMALKLLLVEVEESGNAQATDFGWKPAVEGAHAAIAKATEVE